MELHQILVDDTDRVKMIAESMREIGLQTPISVWSPDNGGTIRLVAGRHRLERRSSSGGITSNAPG